MKTQKLKLLAKFLFFITFCAVLFETGCNEDKEILYKGKIVFDTDIQSMLNCGPFNVDIYIDDIQIGYISQASGQERKTPEFASTDSTLFLEMDTGTYNYYAEFNCGSNGHWNGELEIKPGSSIHVFLDYENCVIENEVEEVCDYETTETDPVKLIIGKWVEAKADDIPTSQTIYWEFGPDSLFKWQTFLQNGEMHTTYRKYWVDSLLHFNIDGGFSLTPWHYEFPDNCTLNLGSAFLIDDPLIYSFKRTKQ